MSSRYFETYRRWQQDPQDFWKEAAEAIQWITPPSASLLLIGTYTAASFTSASDHNGGTYIADPLTSGTQGAITNPVA